MSLASLSKQAEHPSDVSVARHASSSFVVIPAGGVSGLPPRLTVSWWKPSSMRNTDVAPPKDASKAGPSWAL